VKVREALRHVIDVQSEEELSEVYNAVRDCGKKL
jgi:hypothetical protein